VTPAPPPELEGFYADPAEVVAGGAARLSWRAAHASKVVLEQDPGALGSEGQRDVTPTSTTTYTLSATGPGGAATATATVTVRAVALPTILDFSATPSTVAAGQTAALQWLTQGAAAVSIDQGIGSVAATSTAASLPGSGVFTLTATGPGGTVTARAPVTVLPANQGPPSFSAARRVLAAGESTTLSWSAPGASKVTLDHGVGAVTGGLATVKPAVSTTYLLTVTYPTGAVVLPETVTVHPAAAGVWIASFAADASLVRAGQPTTLRWTVSNATQVRLEPALGAVAASGSLPVSPSATTTYTLTATDGHATASAAVQVAVDAAAPLTPSDPGGAPDVLVTVDTVHGVHPISPLIYGVSAAFPNEPTAAYAPALVRLGGTRWGAYNWETNASCAGADFQFLSDAYLGGGLTPAGAVLPTLRQCQDRSSARSGCATMVTIPNQGWVAADRAGPVAIAGPQPYRFHPTVPRKGASFSAAPDTADRVVYQDELAWALSAAAPLARTDPARPLLFELGNEPDIYADRHAEVQHAPLTYAALIAQTIGSAAAVKDAVPGALVAAPALSGWHGWFNLQDAPDAAGRNFIDVFLAQLKAASDAQGRRLLDALDVHFYPDVWCGEQRISEPGPDAASPCAAAARVQLPRSPWDPAYVEDSWITKAGSGGQTGGAPVLLLPRLRATVAAGFAGTKLALTEYRYGGGGHISGAVAQADALGVFGREGLWLASYFPAAPVEPYVAGAFRAFRDFDGAGAAFGDLSVSATSSDVSKVAAYASVDAASPDRVVLVLINRDLSARSVAVRVSHPRPLRSLAAWRIAEPALVVDGAVRPQALPPVTLAKANAALLALPPMSITTAVLSQ
jgi:hypothetical protein